MQAQSNPVEIRELLTRVCGEPVKVQLERRFPEAEYRNGRVLELSRELVLVRMLDDFRFDGFEISRIDDVIGLRSDRSERFFEFVMAAEGRDQRLPSPPSIDLTNFESVLLGLLEHDPVVAIECEGRLDESGRPDFHLGKLLSVGPVVEVSFVGIDGSHDPVPSRLRLEHITRIEFGTDYLRLFEKYADWGASTPKH